MASRLQNIMGYGESQVTPSSNIDGGQIVQLYQQNKANQENQRRYDDRQKDQNEKDQYGIIGDALNPKNFNQAIHGRILQAQKELAQKIKSGNPSYGDTFLLAQNKAAELGQVSQQLNAVDQQLALTKKEYEFDKRINSGAIEMAARKRILDELNSNGTIDGSINYFDEALNDNPDIALIDKSGYTFTDLRPEEKQPLEYDIKKRNALGKTIQYKWKMDNVPAYYDVQQGGEYDPPKVITRSEVSGFKDANNKDVPMLSEEAYRRFSLTPSNVIALNQRIKSQYPNINLRSAIADKLRRVEAYKDIDRNKPSPKESIVEQQPIPRIYNTTNVNTSNTPGQIDLREYPDTDGGKDITSLMQGVDVVSLVTGKKFAANKVVYNPSTQRITVTDPVNNKPEEMSLTTFLQNAKPQNAAADIKFLQGLRNPITGNAPAKQSASTYTIKGKTYSIDDLKKMGYTEEQVKQYKNK